MVLSICKLVPDSQRSEPLVKLARYNLGLSVATRVRPGVGDEGILPSILVVLWESDQNASLSSHDGLRFDFYSELLIFLSDYIA